VDVDVNGITRHTSFQKVYLSVILKKNKWEASYGYSFEPGNEHNYIELNFSERLNIGVEEENCDSLRFYLPEVDLEKISHLF
jgi:hypothetical protein